MRLQHCASICDEGNHDRSSMNATWTRNGHRDVNSTTECYASHCLGVPVAECAFIDQWGWRCSLRCCRGHVLDIDDQPYCWRHAGLCLAVGGNEIPRFTELEDAFRQVPSLLVWASRGLDPDVRQLLEYAVDAEEITVEQDVTADPMGLRWSTRWRDPATDVSVVILIEGAGDPEVRVYDGDACVFHERPDWLFMHRSRIELNVEQDQQLRVAFLERLTAVLTVRMFVAGDIDFTTVNLSGHGPRVGPAARAGTFEEAYDDVG